MALLRCTPIVAGLALLLVARDGGAVECTPDYARSAIAALNLTIERRLGAFPTMPDDAVVPGTTPGSWMMATGGIAAARYIETMTVDELVRQDRNLVAAGHNLDGLHLSLAGQCGALLALDEQKRARELVDQFDPWVKAWSAALPAERARRASDRAAAAATCSVLPLLAEQRARMAQEKANPSGVVDLAALHTTGQIVQAYEAVIAARKALFLRDRGKVLQVSMCAAPAR